MKTAETVIPGCYELCLSPYADARGVFVKTYHHSVLRELNLECSFRETFYTVSGPNVLRGMHLQLPPADQAKLVFCVVGQVMDVLLDLRIGSPAYGQHIMVELGTARHNAIYLSRGVAHGFYVLQAPAILVYQVTCEHVPHLDGGVAWNSFGAPWPDPSPLISQRDASLPRFENFQSPFVYQTEELK